MIPLEQHCMRKLLFIGMSWCDCLSDCAPVHTDPAYRLTPGGIVSCPHIPNFHKAQIEDEWDLYVLRLSYAIEIM